MLRSSMGYLYLFTFTWHTLINLIKWHCTAGFVFNKECNKGPIYSFLKSIKIKKHRFKILAYNCKMTTTRHIEIHCRNQTCIHHVLRRCVTVHIRHHVLLKVDVWLHKKHTDNNSMHLGFSITSSHPAQQLINASFCPGYNCCVSRINNCHYLLLIVLKVDTDFTKNTATRECNRSPWIGRFWSDCDPCRRWHHMLCRWQRCRHSGRAATSYCRIGAGLWKCTGPRALIWSTVDRRWFRINTRISSISTMLW